jgi:hypothetical protein
MMTLEEAIAQDTGTVPREGTVGRLLPDWCEVGTITITSGTLGVADFFVIPDGIQVPVPVGTFQVEVRLISFDGNFEIASARAWTGNVAPTQVGPQLGEIGVDMAHVVFADFASITAAAGSPDELYDSLDRAPMNDPASVDQIWIGDQEFRFASCLSGFGDGNYAVFGLVAGGETVGLEVRFLADGHVMGT